MFETKQIGDTELSLINEGKHNLLNRLNYNKKVFLYGIVIGWSLVLIMWLNAKDIDEPPLFLSAMAYALVFVWVFYKEFRSIKNNLNGLDFIIRKNQLNVLRIRSERFYQLEELHDFGEYYIFEVTPNKLIFLGGQEFYPTINFPNSHFEIIEGKDENGNLILFEIVKKGKKIEPLKKFRGSDCELIFNMPELSDFGEYIEIDGSLSLIDKYINQHK